MPSEHTSPLSNNSPLLFTPFFPTIRIRHMYGRTLFACAFWYPPLLLLWTWFSGPPRVHHGRPFIHFFLEAIICHLSHLDSIASLDLFFLLSSFAWGNFTIFNRPFQRILIPFLDSILDLRFFLLSLRVLLISFWTLHSASEIARGFGVYTTYKDCLIILFFFVFHFWFSILKKEVRKTRYGVLVWEGVLGSACCLLAKIPKKWRCCIHGVIILWVEAIVGHVFKLSIHFIPAVGYYWRPRTLTACLFILLPALSNPSDVCRQKVVSPFDCPSRGSCDSS